MRLTRGVISEDNPNAEVKDLITKFELPILTIIPLNSLAVETVDISFEMEVKSSFSESEAESSTKKKSAEASAEFSYNGKKVGVSIKGSASYSSEDSKTHDTHYEKSNSAKYTIAVHAGQLPLPNGVNIIIDAFSKSISPIVLEGRES